MEMNARCLDFSSALNPPLPVEDPEAVQTVDRQVDSCGQRCSAASPHTRNFCSRFKRSKDRFYSHKIT